MIVKKIIYLDSNIEVCCVKTEKAEVEKICPELVQHIFFCYSIGLVNNPVNRVKETIKIEKKDITFVKNYILISFNLDGLLKPEECEFSIHSITFFLKDNSRLEVHIGKTEAFKHIESDPAIFENLFKRTKKPSGSNLIPHNKNKNLSKTINVKSNPVMPVSNEPEVDVEDIKHFIDSYEKFKAQFKNSEIQELLENKPSTMDFNLKNFGFSLLCKLLLLIKSVNELVDNDFQKDLHQFLRDQILNQLKTEVTA